MPDRASTQLTFRRRYTAEKEDAQVLLFELADYPDAASTRRVEVVVEGELRASFRLNGHDETVPEPTRDFYDAVCRLVLQQVMSMGSEVLVADDPSVPLELRFGAPRYKEVEAAFKRSCSFQERRGRDLYCGIADSSTKQLTAETSLHVCANHCDLPDDRLLCSHLTHLKMLIPANTVPRPKLGPRLCDIGHDEAAKAHGKCVPLGHSCWTKILWGEEASIVSTGPFDLHVHLDFFNAAWRVRFGKEHPIVVLPSATVIASLSQPCVTRSDFTTMLSELDDLIKRLRVPDTFLSAGFLAKDNDRSKTLLRLDDAIDCQIRDDDDRVRGHDAVRVLRTVNRIRAGLQHTGEQQRRLPVNAAKLGFEWPPASWQRAWACVVHEVCGALAELRASIED